MTPGELARLRELDRKASPAPWSYNPWSANSSGEVTQNVTYGWGEDEEILIGEVSCILDEHDAEMIAQARNALPVLLAEIERLSAEKAQAWEEGRKEGQYIGRQLERTGYGILYKNPYEEDKQ